MTSTRGDAERRANGLEPLPAAAERKFFRRLLSEPPQDDEHRTIEIEDGCPGDADGGGSRDPLKLVSYTVGIGKLRVHVCADLLGAWHGTTGSSLWAAGPALASYLLRSEAAPLHGAAVLELGAGLGVLGNALAAHGAGRVCLTDVPQQVPLLRHNVAANAGSRAAGCAVEAAPLVWGTRPLAEQFLRTRWDYIVGSDICYDVEGWDALAQTLSDLVPADDGDVASHPKVFLAFPKRKIGQHLAYAGFLFSVQEQGFAAKQLTTVKGRAGEIDVFRFQRARR